MITNSVGGHMIMADSVMSGYHPKKFGNQTSFCTTRNVIVKADCDTVLTFVEYQLLSGCPTNHI